MRRSLCSLLLALGFTVPTPAQEPVQVITTIHDLTDLVHIIGGERVAITELVPPGANPHTVLPKASMLLQLARADVLILMGIDYEHAFLPALLEKSRNKRIQPGADGYMNIGAFIQPLEVPQSLDRGQAADLHPRGNPHYNLDPINGRIMAAAVRDVLVRVDAAHAAEYRRRWEAWDTEARTRIQRWARLMAPLRGKKIVTYHRSWSYFVARYGLEVVAEIEPKPGLAPSAKHLVAVKRLMRKEGVQVVVMAPWYNERSIRNLVGEGVSLLKLPTTSGLREETMHYLDYIDHLVRSMRMAFGLSADEDPREDHG